MLGIRRSPEGELVEAAGAAAEVVAVAVVAAAVAAAGERQVAEVEHTGAAVAAGQDQPSQESAGQVAVAEQEVVRSLDMVVAAVAAGKLLAEAVEVVAAVDSQPAAVAVAADQAVPVAEVDIQQVEAAVEDRTGILAAGRTPSEDQQAAQVRTAKNKPRVSLCPKCLQFMQWFMYLHVFCRSRSRSILRLSLARLTISLLGPVRLLRGSLRRSSEQLRVPAVDRLSLLSVVISSTRTALSGTVVVVHG